MALNAIMAGCLPAYMPVLLAALEAMACGVPVVTLDCPSGPGEIVRDEIDGLVVAANDLRGLQEALRRVMSDDELRARFAARAPEVLGRFSEQKFLAQWDAVLDGNSEDDVDAILPG